MGSMPPLSPLSFEIAPAPCVLVFFGATGDLARRKLLPSLLQLDAFGLLHASARIVGCGRTPLDDASFRALAAAALPKSVAAAARGTRFWRASPTPGPTPPTRRRSRPSPTI